MSCSRGAGLGLDQNWLCPAKTLSSDAASPRLRNSTVLILAIPAVGTVAARAWCIAKQATATPTTTGIYFHARLGSRIGNDDFIGTPSLWVSCLPAFRILYPLVYQKPKQ